MCSGPMVHLSFLKKMFEGLSIIQLNLVSLFEMGRTRLGLLRKVAILSFVAALTLLHISCQKDDEHQCPALDEYGLTPQINEILPPSIRDTLINWRFTLYGGNSLPYLEGKYFISPHDLISSNRPCDNIGNIFSDLTLGMQNQSYEDLTAEILTTDSNSGSEGRTSYIVGYNNSFTLVAPEEGQSEGSDFKSVFIISGRMPDNGIHEAQLAAFITEDYGDPNNVLIDIGEGRIFMDGDSFSQRIN